jgi:DNA repair protein RecO (recombination protein O)
LLHHTKGIIIRTVNYGETSVVLTVFTELFGLQQYIVNGVRTSKRSSGFSAAQMQVGNMLDMVVYQNQKNTLQRIKECKYYMHYSSLFEDVTKNAVMLFMIEVLQKAIKQPDPHPELFYFIEDIMKGLDQATASQTANIPLFFMLHLSHFFGFRMMDNYAETMNILDLREGQFISALPMHQMVLIPPYSAYVAQLLRVMQIEELDQIRLNRQLRAELLDACIDYYSLHINPFGPLRSVPVIRMLLED